MTAEKEYCISITEKKQKFCFSLNYNWVNSYILVNYTEICKFHYVWVMFRDTFDNMKKTRLYGYV